MNLRDIDLAGNQLIEGVLINILKSRQGHPELVTVQSSIEVNIVCLLSFAFFFNASLKIADMGTPPSAAYYHYQSIQSIWFSDTPSPERVQERYYPHHLSFDS